MTEGTLLLICVRCRGRANFDGKSWWDTVKEISDDKYEDATPAARRISGAGIHRR